MKRPLRQRPRVVVASVLVTQLNCEAVIGVNARRYLEIVVPLCNGHVVSLGKLRAIPVDVVLEKLRSRAIDDTGKTEPTFDDHEQFDTPDAVLARIGMRKSA